MVQHGVAGSAADNGAGDVHGNATRGSRLAQPLRAHAGTSRLAGNAPHLTVCPPAYNRVDFVGQNSEVTPVL